MRWLKSFAVYAAAVASLAKAEVPESLSEAFVFGMTLTVRFGDIMVQDGTTTSARSISSSPVFTLNSPDTPIPDATRYTIIMMDITNSRNPTTEAVLHYVESNLQAPAPEGGDLGNGVINLPYKPPAEDNGANYLFMVYAQLDGDIKLQGIPEQGDNSLFSVNIFRQENSFQLADTGIGFTVSNTGNDGTTTSEPPATTTSEPLTTTTSEPLTTTTSEPLTTTTFTFPNTTTTSTEPSSTSEETTTVSIDSTTTTSPPETTTPPSEPITSYLTLSVSGSTRTVIFTRPNDPGSTLTPVTRTGTTSTNPSLITTVPNAGSQKAVPRSAIALLGFYIAFVAFA